MIKLNRFLDSKEGIIIISLILGFGLATLFKKVCLGPSCIVFEAPPSDELTNKVIKYNYKCYKNYPEHVKCIKKSKKAKFSDNYIDS